MSSLADLPEVVGFFSYSREDDEASRGMLSAVRDGIQGELSGQLGRSKATFRLWQDQVNSKGLRSFLSKAQHCRAAIADPLAGALPGTDNDSDLPREADHFLSRPAPPNSKTITRSRRYYGITNERIGVPGTAVNWCWCSQPSFFRRTSSANYNEATEPL